MKRSGRAGVSEGVDLPTTPEPGGNVIGRGDGAGAVRLPYPDGERNATSVNRTV